ncbi:MAG: efflux RND transporter periplasmic adaptor subunit [Deltaproteobacteria bacterium]|nr:efflux RND transporter periplasmic adaptor subunit [Deltaproteobacteria bacterium]MBW2071352.1 efflux RND transporter periplasmic adaptor subunit [Deltaproteobacteria bacterium]
MKLKPQYHFIFALLLLGCGCSDKIEPGTAEVQHPLVTGVQIATVRLESQPVIYNAVGTVRAGITSSLAAEVMGTVKAVEVREGDQVKAGGILIRLDQRQARAQLREVRATLSEAEQALRAAFSARDQARSTAQLAAATYHRYQSLKQEESVSAQEFDEVEARYLEARAARERAEAMASAAASRVRQARAAVAAARVRLNYTLIKAPHDGIITGKFVDEGDLAIPGRTLLTLETTHGYHLDLVVPERYIEQVHLGQMVSAAIPALSLTGLAGTVSTIVPAADPDSRSFLIKVALPPGAALRSGMFARVNIPLGQQLQIRVPRSAIIRQGQLTGIYLVDGDNVVHFRLLRLGRVYPEVVEVLSGLQQGERYVVEVIPSLVDGARVEEAS